MSSVLCTISIVPMEQLLVNTAKHFRTLVFLFSFSDSDFFWIYFMLGTMYEEPQVGAQDRDTLVASLAIWQGKDRQLFALGADYYLSLQEVHSIAEN